MIYKITRELDKCLETCDGETYRPLWYRFDEHYRSAANPSEKSYIDKPLAKHYREKHPNHTDPSQLKLKTMAQRKAAKSRSNTEQRILPTKQH